MRGFRGAKIVDRTDLAQKAYRSDTTDMMRKVPAAGRNVFLATAAAVVFSGAAQIAWAQTSNPATAVAPGVNRLTQGSAPASQSAQALPAITPVNLEPVPLPPIAPPLTTVPGGGSSFEHSPITQLQPLTLNDVESMALANNPTLGQAAGALVLCKVIGSSKGCILILA